MISEPEIGVTVGMANHDGQEWGAEELDSIFQHISPEGEPVVIDKASAQGTPEPVWGTRDQRIGLMQDRHRQRYVASFKKATTASRGQSILLSDQGEVWLPCRMDLLVNSLQKKCFSASEFAATRKSPNNLQKVQLRERVSGRWIADIFAKWTVYRPYYGCTLALRAAGKKLVFPVPGFPTETRDQRIALVANHHRGINIDCRLHAENSTPARIRSQVVVFPAGTCLFKQTMSVAIIRKLARG